MSTGCSDLDDGIVWVFYLRLSDLFHGDLEWSFVVYGLHLRVVSCYEEWIGYLVGDSSGESNWKSGRAPVYLQFTKTIRLRIKACFGTCNPASAA